MVTTEEKTDQTFNLSTNPLDHKPHELAVIKALWIGETKPDTFSRWIQYFLTWTTTRPYYWLKAFITGHGMIDYSHNAFQFFYTGMVWEASTPGGVQETTYKKATKGAVVRHEKLILLKITNEQLQWWLMGETGKGYAHRGNIASIFPFMSWFAPNSESQRSCSNFLARVCHWSKYTFPKDVGKVLPTDTYRVIVLEEPFKKTKTKRG